jgi:phosphate transport system substrate-binding protein
LQCTHPIPESTVPKSSLFRVAALAIALGFAANAQAADVTGAGASFIYPVMSKWSADYAKAAGKQVNYQSIGSGGGIAQIKAGTVDFGSSDAPLTPEELAKFGLAQFPSVIGGVGIGGEAEREGDGCGAEHAGFEHGLAPGWDAPIASRRGDRGMSAGLQGDDRRGRAGGFIRR